jgi:HD-like signal output (HDOD) protein
MQKIKDVLRLHLLDSFNPLVSIRSLFLSSFIRPSGGHYLLTLWKLSSDIHTVLAFIHNWERPTRTRAIVPKSLSAASKLAAPQASGPMPHAAR